MDRRREKMRWVLEQRMSWVECAIEAVYHRHNVSAAVLRTCDALGLSRVHLVEGHFVPSKGAARGAERWLDLRHHQTQAEAVRAIRDAGFALWVADFAEPPVAPEEVPIDRPVCLWFGAELAGVSAETRAAADGVVTLPMRGFAQSLNISVAAGLVLHAVAERVRQAHGDRALLDPITRERTWDAWIAREDAMRANTEARILPLVERH